MGTMNTTMRSLKHILMLLFVVLLVSASVAASTYTERNYFYNSNMQPLTDVDVDVYRCPDSDSNCNTVTQQLINGNSGDNEFTYSVTTHPSQIRHFAEYFTKSCYLPKAYRISVSGDHNIYFDTKLYQANGCEADVQNVYVSGELETGKPLVINTQTKLGATTYSAFTIYNVPPGYIPPGDKEEFYSVDTKTVMKVKKVSTGQIIYTSEAKYDTIFADEHTDNTWQWTAPDQAGEYEIIIESEVVDCQCATQNKRIATKRIFITQSLDDSCFTLVNNLQVLPVNAKVGEAVDISGRVKGEFPAMPNLQVKVKATAYLPSGSSNQVYSSTKSIAQNVNYQTVHFTWVPTQAGLHGIRLDAYIENPDCTQNQFETKDFRVESGPPPQDLPPTTPYVSVTPSVNAYDRDNLLCTASGSTDPDDNVNQITYEYRWKKNDALQNQYANNRNIPASATTPGDRWKCEARALSYGKYSAWGSDDTFIQANPQEDRAPIVTSVTLVPTPTALDTQDLYCTINGNDPDGTSVTFIYKWYRNNGAMPSYNNVRTIPASATTPGEVWICQGQAYSNGKYSSTMNSAPTTIVAVNHAPLADNVNVQTNKNTPVSVQLSCFDQDGNTLTYSIVSNPSHGSLSGSGSTRTYTPYNNYVGADSFTYRCSDGQAYSNNAIVSINVNNVQTDRAPIMNTVTLAPAPNANDDQQLVCSANGYDPDGTSVSYIYKWYRNSGYLPIYNNQATIPASATIPGEIWTCSGQASSNGLLSTVITSNPTTIVAIQQNHAPVAYNVNVQTNKNIAVNVQFSCTDADGNALTYSIVSNPSHGSLSGSGSTRTYTPYNNYVGADSFTYRCHDGLVYSNNAIVSINVNAPADRPPTQAIATITPKPAYNSNNLFCQGSGSTDPDGPPAPTYTYAWQLNGQPTTYTGQTILASLTYVGDIWTCIATPWSNGLSGPSGSDYVQIQNDIVADYCTETDGGFFPKIRSTASHNTYGYAIVESEFCKTATSDNRDLVEFTCVNNRIVKQDVRCAANELCINGACVDQINDYHVDVVVSPKPAQNSNNLQCTIVNPMSSMTYQFKWYEDGLLIEQGTLPAGIYADTLLASETEEGKTYLCHVDAYYNSLFVSQDEDYTTVTRTAQCSDSDNGFEIFVFGTVQYTDTNGQSGSIQDTCVNGNNHLINEAFCDANNHGTSQQTNCPTDYICSNGACVFDPGTITTPVVQVTPKPAEDSQDLFCQVIGPLPINPSYTYHYSWLENGNPTGITTQTVDDVHTDIGEVWTCRVRAEYLGGFGQYGQDSTTIVADSYCVDSDNGVDAYTPGYVDYNNQFGVLTSVNDACKSIGNIVIEKSCSASLTLVSTEVTCNPGYQCEVNAQGRGYCAPVTVQTCSDPDGNNIFNAGTVTITQTTLGVDVDTYYDDFCIDADTVQELGCQGINLYYYPPANCAAGSMCSNGACIDIPEKPTTPTVVVTPKPAYDSNDLLCTASGSMDGDGTAVSYIYEWFNEFGVSRGIFTQTVDDSLTSVGQTWVCRAWAFSGNETSDNYGEDFVVIQNQAPEFISHPNGDICDESGHEYISQFSYRVEAIDPDGGAIYYELIVAPDGMTLDPFTGQIDWHVTSGDRYVTIKATDSFGKATYQNFFMPGCYPLIDDADVVMHFNRLSVANEDCIKPGDTVELYYDVENIGHDKIKDLKVSALVHEWDAYDSQYFGTLRTSREATGVLRLEVPQNIRAGLYTIQVGATNEQLRRIVFRDVRIKTSCVRTY